jgi:hypothetical protein
MDAQIQREKSRRFRGLARIQLSHLPCSPNEKHDPENPQHYIPAVISESDLQAAVEASGLSECDLLDRSTKHISHLRLLPNFKLECLAQEQLFTPVQNRDDGMLTVALYSQGLLSPAQLF